MKKTIAILFAALLAVSMSACGTSQDTKQEESSVQSEVSVAQEESSEEEESIIEEEQEEESQPESKEESSEESAPSSEKEKLDTNEESGIDPEFKKAMDSYEAFFDDYVEFMKKYQNSDDIAGLMGEYTDFLTKYAETMEALNSIDESDLSEEEALYYMEVSTRISQKLLEVTE